MANVRRRIICVSILKQKARQRGRERKKASDKAESVCSDVKSTKILRKNVQILVQKLSTFNRLKNKI